MFACHADILFGSFFFLPLAWAQNLMCISHCQYLMESPLLLLALFSLPPSVPLLHTNSDERKKGRNAKYYAIEITFISHNSGKCLDHPKQKPGLTLSKLGFQARSSLGPGPSLGLAQALLRPSIGPILISYYSLLFDQSLLSLSFHLFFFH